MHLIITGYYKKDNLGDDLFEIFAEKIVNNKKFMKNITTYKILPIDKIILYENRSPVDRVILFGGETLNNYFLDKLIELWNFNKAIKFNAIGVSCNQDYYEILNKVHIFESIWFRSKKNYNFFNKYISSQYCPDIVFLMKNNFSLRDIGIKRHVGFFLSQTAIANLNKKNEHQYLDSIVEYIKYIVSRGLKVYLFPMCTNEKYQEDDNIINIKLLDKFSDHEKTSIKAYSTNKKVLAKIHKLKFTVCYRYHAHILSIIHNIPFISISDTPKVNDLLNESDLNMLSTNYSKLIDKTNEILEKKTFKLIKNKLNTVYKKFHKETYKYLNKNIYFEDKKENIFYLEPKNYPIIYDFILKKYDILKTDDKIFNTQIVTFYFTRALDNKYNFGLEEKINKGLDNLRGDIYWLINDCIKDKNMYFYESVAELLNINMHIEKPLNIRFINQDDYKGLHRSGWQYVVDHLINYHSTNAIYCDLYIDRSFHWNYTEYKKLNIIPYRNNWIGFIHHTTDTEYTSYNTINLFKNKLFLVSLLYCKGLFVLSHDLKDKIDKLLYSKNLRIPVYALTHPTEFVSSTNVFSMKKFNNNKNKKIIQIGAWLRVIDAINKLDLGENKLKLQKCILKGKKMENYYVDNETENELELETTYNETFNDKDDDDDKDHDDSDDEINGFDDLNTLEELDDKIRYREIGSVSRDNKRRKTRIVDTVHVIKYLENNDYDSLLSKNIVFINLVGASAVNTVIECIVRNTPIIINRLPALIEVLGDKYPLFYDNIEDVHLLLTRSKINSGHVYLKSLNKDKFKLETFMKEFLSIVNNINNMIKLENESVV